MNIAETIAFDKQGEPESKSRGWVRKFFLSALILLIALLSFGIGRLTGGQGSEPVKIEYDQQISNYSNSPNYPKETPITQTSQTVYASKNGKKYYYYHCSGLNRILEANIVSFATAIAAEASGYTPASGCSQR